MRCKCGYSFSQKITASPRQCESYALVNDKNYQAFLKSEIGVIQAGNERTKMCAIARSSKYLGSLLECPQCSRLVLLKPNGKSPRRGPIFFKRENNVRLKT